MSYDRACMEYIFIDSPIAHHMKHCLSQMKELVLGRIGGVPVCTNELIHLLPFPYCGKRQIT